MGLVRIVVQGTDGTPSPGLNVALRPSEPGKPVAGSGTTDGEGVVRFRVSPAIYKLEFAGLPNGVTTPKYGTTVRLEDFAEGIEQIVRLVKA